jgi:hypothetical protein
MAILQRGADLFYTFRFIKLLVTRWENTDAFKLGIIDKEGKPIKKVRDLNTSEEKSSYTMFHRLVYNIKRIVNKVPLVGKTSLASWAAALWLIKEETGMSEKAIVKLMEKYAGDNDIELDTSLYESNGWSSDENGNLRQGRYTLTENMISPKTGEVIARAGSTVKVNEPTIPSGTILGANIYAVEHISTRQTIYITTSDIVQ